MSLGRITRPCSQERLGHASITTTLNVYGHLFPSLDEELAGRLDAMAIAAAGDARSVPDRPNGEVLQLIGQAH